MSGIQSKISQHRKNQEMWSILKRKVRQKISHPISSRCWNYQTLESSSWKTDPKMTSQSFFCLMVTMALYNLLSLGLDRICNLILSNRVWQRWYDTNPSIRFLSMAKVGSIPVWGIISHMLELRFRILLIKIRMLQQDIPHAATKTQCRCRFNDYVVLKKILS